MSSSAAAQPSPCLADDSRSSDSSDIRIFNPDRKQFLPEGFDGAIWWLRSERRSAGLSRAMQPTGAADGNVLEGPSYDATSRITTPPILSIVEKGHDDAVDGYFDLQRERGASPDSPRSQALSMIDHANAIAPAFAALQYLPVPLIVLSSAKTVILANEAMGRLLDIDFAMCGTDMDSDGTGALSITDILRGYRMGQLGIDLLQGGSPIMVSWEVSQPDHYHIAAICCALLFACPSYFACIPDTYNSAGLPRRCHKQILKQQRRC